MSAVARCARRVLVAEDHVLLAGRIAEGTARQRPGGGRRPRRLAALTHAGLTACDVIVLERDLPGAHGARVCRTLAGGSAQIMMLTAAAGPLATL
jgi:DNA-binding response OmpR family regulator